MNTSIYLDNNATTQPAPEVLAAMLDCLRDCWGNPSSKHHMGEAAKERLMNAHAQVGALIGAAPAEIVFTGSATEANHTALLGALAMSEGRRHVVASAVEHTSTMLLLKHLQDSGVRVTYVGVDAQGQLNLDQLAASIADDTAVVSLMWANNETGVIFPVVQAAELAKRRGVLFHTDAVQAAGRIAIDVKHVPVDFLSMAGHKLHAAKGVGALFVRKGIKMPPLIFGHQQRGRRGGTENLDGIVGMGVAAELAARRQERDAPAIAALRDRLEQGLIERLPQTQINSANAMRLPNTSSLRFGTADAEIVLARLDRAGICASSGSACTAGATAPSHALLAMGMSSQQALATVRFSLSRYTDAEEIDAVLEIMPDIVQPVTTYAN